MVCFSPKRLLLALTFLGLCPLCMAHQLPSHDVLAKQKADNSTVHANGNSRKKPLNLSLLRYGAGPGYRFNPNTALADFGKKNVLVDPYTGQLRLKIPLINVPVGGGLSIRVTAISGDYRRFFRWASTNYNSEYDFLMDLGVNRTLTPGITGQKVNTTNQFIPSFVTPDGGTHLFYPKVGEKISENQALQYFSSDGWNAVLVGHHQPAHTQPANGGDTWVYSGTVTNPKGIKYTIAPGLGGISNIKQITNSSGKAWIKYTYATGTHDDNIATISSSSGYTVNFSYSNMARDPESSAVYNLCSSITTSDNKAFKFSYIRAGFKGWSLNGITLPSGEKWKLGFNKATYCGKYMWDYTLSTITYPSGASQSFKYTCTNINDKRSGGLAVSSETSNKLPPFAQTNYSYSASGTKATTVQSYGNKVITYNFDFPSMDKDIKWNTGLLLSKSTANKSTGKVIRSESQTWQERKISDLIGGGQPELTKRVINQDGSTYTLSNSAFDDWGFVTETTATGNDVRTISRQYYENLKNWFFGLSSETVKDNKGQVLNTQVNSYNSLGQLEKSSLNGLDTSFSYNAQGDVASKSDALGHITTFNNYEYGHPSEIIGPIISSTNKPAFDTHFSMNTDGTIANQIDSFGNETAYTYDAMDRVTGITNFIGTDPGHPAQDPIHIQWDMPNLGDEILTQGDYQQVTQYLNNPSNQYEKMVTTTDTQSGKAKQSIVVFQEDGLPASTATSIGDFSPQQLATVTQSYDVLGRILRKEVNGENPVTYSYGPNTISITDPQGGTKQYSYQNFDQPTDKSVIGLTNKLGHQTSTTRDAMGRILSISQNGLTRSYQYDPNNHYYLSSEVTPDLGTVHYNRDALGKITSRSINDQTTNYMYDEAGNLVHVKYPDATGDISKAYDFGRLTISANPQGSWTYSYNALGNMASATFTPTGSEKTYSMSFAYDGLGHINTITYPDGKKVSYGPNAFGVPTSVGANITHVEGYANGHIKDYLTGDSNTVSYSEDAFGRISTLLANHSGSPLINETYGYDKNNNTLSITDALNASNSEFFTYDAANELVAAQGPWGKAQISYDAGSNITSMAEGTSQLSYHYNSKGQLSGVTGTTPQTFSYDGNGNMSGVGGKALLFNADNQLVSVDGKTKYQYDSNGNRVSVQTPKGALLELYLNNKLMYSQSKENAALKTNDFIYLGHRLVERDSDDNTIYYYNNLLGSPLGVSDSKSAGQLLWRQHYAPYGKELFDLSEKRTDTHIGYTGKDLDDSLGLNYMNARFYAPELGRFISEDPASIDPSNAWTFNRYAYANNNPYSFTDPTGMWPSWLPSYIGVEFSSGFASTSDGSSWNTGVNLDGLHYIAYQAGQITGAASYEFYRDMPAITPEATGIYGAAVGGVKYLTRAVTGSEKYWSESEFRGTKVFQRDDLFDPHSIDGRGRTNLERMAAGRAPEDMYGDSIQLHHLIQTNDSALAEVSQRFHQGYSKIIHINPNSVKSQINRSEFGAYRRAYWKNRANDF